MKRSFSGTYSGFIWYSFVYWIINALTITVAFPKALLKKKGTRAVWKSSDRGLDRLAKRKGKSTYA